MIIWRASFTLKADFKKIRSLRDPSKKMSKSDVNANSRIELMDSPDLIKKKLRKAVTGWHISRKLRSR